MEGGDRRGEVRPLDLLGCAVTTVAVCVLPLADVAGALSIHAFWLLQIGNFGLLSGLALAVFSLWGTLGRGRRARFLGALASLGWLGVFSVFRLDAFPSSAASWGLGVAAAGPLLVLLGLVPKLRRPDHGEQVQADRRRASETRWLWASVLTVVVALALARSAGLVREGREDYAFLACIAVAVALTYAIRAPRKLVLWFALGWTCAGTVLVAATPVQLGWVVSAWASGLGVLWLWDRQKARIVPTADPLATYVARVVDGDGNETAKRVSARTMSDARQMLQADGFSDVVFERGQFAAAIESPQLRDYLNQNLTPEQELDLGCQSPVRTVLRNLLLHSPIWMTLVVWNAYCIWAGRPYDWTDYLSFACSVVFLVYLVVVNAGAVLFDRVRHAEAWNSWDDALLHLRWLKLLNRLFWRNPTLTADFDVREARARAGKGDLASGIALVERQADNYPEDLYLAQLSSVYAAARDYRHELQLKRRSAAVGEGKAYAQLDLAWALISRWRELDEGARLIDQADAQELTALERLFLDRAKGALLIERGDVEEGIALLHDVAARSAQSRQRHFASFDAKTIALLCIGEASRGERERARALLGRIETYLAAVGETELLARCRQAAA